MKKGKILVVDDVEINRIILEEILIKDYEVVHADNGIVAIDYMFNAKVPPDLVLLDIMMPEMDGFEVLDIMKTNTRVNRIPVIFITASDASTNETKGLKAGAADYISKPFNSDVVKVRVDNQIELMEYRHNLEVMVDKKVDELISTKEKMLETMAAIIEYRNLESGEHVYRTCQLMKTLIDHLVSKHNFFSKYTEEEFGVIVKATALHDIGKIGIPDKILLKPAQLDKEEFEIIKTHTTIGSDIIDSLLATDDTIYLRHCRDICRSHHEQWGGNGYPDGLKGEEIPLSARMLAVVDVYDALVSKRVYKPPFTHEQAIDIIAKGKGTQFDPEIIDALLEIHERFNELKVS